MAAGRRAPVALKKAGRPPRAPGWGAWRLALLLVPALAVKAVVLAQLHAHPLLQPEGGLDSEVYVALARRAAAGDWALGPDAYFVSPFYVYFLSVVFVFSGGSLLAAKVVQILLGTASVGLVFAAGETWYGRPAAWVAGGLAAATGVFTFNEVLLLQSAMDPFLTAFGLYVLARALTTNRLAAFVLAGAALGLQSINRPNALAWAAALVVLLAVSGLSRRSLLRAGAVVGGLALVVGPVTLRNRVVSEEWILVSSHGGLNFFIGNNPGADGTYRAVAGITPSIAGQAEDARRVAQAAAGRPLSTAEVSDHFYRQGRQWIAREPGRAIALFLEKLAYVFNALDLPLNDSYAYFSRDEPTLLRALVVGPGLLVPLGLLGLAAVPRRAPASGYWIWAAFVPAYAVSVAAFFVSGRYRMPLLVPLCVGAGAASAWLVEQARARNARSLGAAAAALAVLGVAANWDWGLDDGRSEARTQRIVRFVDEGRYDEAQRLLARTRPTHPEPALLLYLVGQALLDRGRLPDAAALLEEALRADPVRPEIRAALARAHEERGVASSLAGRHAEGAAELERAVQLAPESASAQLNLAVAYAQLGRYADARARAEEALRLRPDYPQARGLLEQLGR